MKPQRKVLGITKDGWPLYEGSLFWFVNEDNLREQRTMLIEKSEEYKKKDLYKFKVNLKIKQQ